MSAKYKLAMVLTAAAAFFIASCQSASVDTVNSRAVQSSTVYQDYRVEADSTQTRVTATFRVGGSTGTTIELSEPGKILHNGNALNLSAPGNLLGTNYRMKGTDYRAGTKSYQPNHEFIFTDSGGGATYKNSLSLAPLEIGGGGKSDLVLLKSQPTSVRLSRAVAPNEALTVGLNTSVGGDDVPTRGNSVYLNPSRDALIITPQYWREKVSGGKATLHVKISRRENVSQGTTVGGAIQIVFASAPAAVTIEKSVAAVNKKANTAAGTKAANANSAAGGDANAANANTDATVSNSLPQPAPAAAAGYLRDSNRAAFSRKYSRRRKTKVP